MSAYYVYAAGKEQLLIHYYTTEVVAESQYIDVLVISKIIIFLCPLACVKMYRAERYCTKKKKKLE